MWSVTSFRITINTDFFHFDFIFVGRVVSLGSPSCEQDILRLSVPLKKKKNEREREKNEIGRKCEIQGDNFGE